MGYRLGVDVGGTFTDVLLVDEETGLSHRAKTASTPAERTEIPVFDMGPPLADILARCEEETGLPAPRPPVDVRSAAALRGGR